jgi:hypothetical protein
MRLSDKEMEKLERDYFEQIFYYLTCNEQRMLNGLASKNKIRSDWWFKFTQSESADQLSELARGAERIFYWLLTTLWMPNSSPIGADLFFEAHNAFIHIDVKTAKSDNPSDSKGKVAIGKNQTSYNPDKTKSGTKITVNPNLPQYYCEGTNLEKPCLTYSIQMVHDATTLEIIAILLISIPNGQLYRVYGNDIVGAGKIKGKSMRYEYKNNFFFNTLEDKPHRVRFIWFNEQYVRSPTSMIKTKNDITARSEIT